MMTELRKNSRVTGSPRPNDSHVRITFGWWWDSSYVHCQLKCREAGHIPSSSSPTVQPHPAVSLVLCPTPMSPGGADIIDKFTFFASLPV